MNWHNFLKQLFISLRNHRINTTTTHQQEHFTEQSSKLTREDVLKLIQENGGPEGLNLSSYDLSGINLSKMDLHEIIFGNFDILVLSDVDVATQCANLEGAWLERSNLRRANFGRTNLQGTHFYHADLTEATLWAANAEGAGFEKADLTKVDLYSANLKDCILSDAQLVGANLYQADLQGVILSAESIGSKILQENLDTYREYYERWYISPDVRDLFANEHLKTRYREAREIYLRLKNAFLNTGRYDDASWASFKERQMERRSFSLFNAKQEYSDELPTNSQFYSPRLWAFHLKYTSKWLSSLAIEALIGYGERPLRVIFWAIVVILAFPLLYWLSGGIVNSARLPIGWLDYLNYSLATFSTIGFPDLVPVNGFAKVLTSLEALSGISTLALLMFAVGNRISRS